jgi:hypothetical protein
LSEEAKQSARRGESSFCVPRAAIEALLNAQATAYEVCAYLTLARYTDRTGVYSTAGMKAINTATGANKTKGGPVERAIERLKKISGKTSKGPLPILFDEQGWIDKTGEIIPPGPIPRADVRFVLPDFDEPSESRVWFGGNLVTGIGEFAKPLKTIKDGGDVVARLLLAMYAATDMEAWGGVDPHKGPWMRYESVDKEALVIADVRLIRAKNEGTVGSGTMFSRAWTAPDRDWWKAHEAAGEPVWRALELLESAGLFYQTVLVLNRNAESKTFASGGKYGSIPADAEPLYVLDTRSQHGYKPAGEEGLAGVTASTASDLSFPVATSGGHFDGTYAAIVKRGQGAMVAGIFRPRFRVANPKNAGVQDVWSGIKARNREHFDFIQAIRAARKLPPAVSPFTDTARAALAAIGKLLAEQEE